MIVVTRTRTHARARTTTLINAKQQQTLLYYAIAITTHLLVRLPLGELALEHSDLGLVVAKELLAQDALAHAPHAVQRQQQRLEQLGADGGQVQGLEGARQLERLLRDPVVELVVLQDVPVAQVHWGVPASLALACMHA